MSRGSDRERVASEAARLLYTREYKEYFHAKREAAKRQGTTALPSNRDIHEQLRLLARSVEGEQGHSERLGHMRRQALLLMERLARFQPKLIGSTLTGHIRNGSDIDLHVFAEEVDDVCAALDEPHVVERVMSRKYGEVIEFVHVKLDDFGGVPVEMTVYTLDWLHVHPRCGITGEAMRRATLPQLRELLARESPEKPTLAPPLDWDELERQVPELSRCRGCLQNHFHHLDVYDHTRNVTETLARDLADGFARWEPWSERLREHFASPTRQTLLLLAGICHDLGKPATQSFDSYGRIRFLGHEIVSAEITRAVAPRFAVDSGALHSLVRWHLEAVLIPPEGWQPSRVHRLFLEVKEHMPALALLSQADVEGARGPAQSDSRLHDHRKFVELLLENHFGQGALAVPRLPLAADDLDDEFGRLPTRLRDRLWQQLIGGYLDGEFESREEGLALASEWLDETPRNATRGR